MNEFLDPSGDQFTPEEKDIDKALRPESFDDFAGQESLLENLKVFVAAANKRDEALDHTLFHGPPGLGKTTLSNIIANEMGVGIKVSSGPVLDKPGDLAGLLTNLEKDDILFNKAIIDKQSLDIISGSIVDFKKELIGESFSIRNPKASASCGCGLSFSV